jgi:hypothetical protein
MRLSGGNERFMPAVTEDGNMQRSALESSIPVKVNDSPHLGQLLAHTVEQ